MLRPNAPGTPTVRAAAVDGSENGSGSPIRYTVPPLPFDLGGSATSPTQAGFLAVSPATLYAPAVGYGWLSAAGGFDGCRRSIPADLRGNLQWTLM
jgi:hypothetical protein